MPKRLTDFAIRYQVLLERLKASEVRSFEQVFFDIDKSVRDILLLLAADDIGNVTRKELTTILSELRDASQALLYQSLDTLDSKLKEIAHQAAEFEHKSLSTVIKASIRVASAEDAYQQALAQPISATGELLRPFLKDWADGEVKRLNNVVQRAWGEGWTNQQAVQAIRGTKRLNFKDGILATSRRNAEAILRTSIQHVATQGRMAVWEKNKDIVSKYRWVSTLDSKTTPICRSLDGKEFPRGQGPTPPAHIGCRSAIVAVVDPSLGLDFLDQGATRSAEFGPVDADLTYYEWLKQQTPQFQDIAIGKTRGLLLREGGLSADQFADLNLGRNFEPLSLDEMRKVAPLAFEKAGIPPKG